MTAFMVIEVLVFGTLGRAEARGAVRNARLRAYAFFIAYQWALVAWIAILWIETKRPWSALLLGSPNRWGFAVSMALTASYVVLMILQRRSIANRPKVLERLQSRIAEIKAIVPHTLRERRIWTLAAITAGCCEEVFFRGYLLTFIASI
jgi:membrane protease YdiL (CAAX protease family)